VCVCVCVRKRELIMGMVQVSLPLYINSALPNTQTMAENAILLPITKSLFLLPHTHKHTTPPLIILYFVFQSAGSSGDNEYFFICF
jgi:hypothetical protein